MNILPAPAPVPASSPLTPIAQELEKTWKGVESGRLNVEQLSTLVKDKMYYFNPQDIPYLKSLNTKLIGIYWHAQEDNHAKNTYDTINKIYELIDTLSNWKAEKPSIKTLPPDLTYKTAAQNFILTHVDKSWRNLLKNPDFLVDFINNQSARQQPIRAKSLEKLIEILKMERVGEHVEELDLEILLSAKERNKITHEKLAELVRLCPNLKSLNLTGCSNISDLSILMTASNLRKLNVSLCDKIQDLGPLMLLDLEELEIGGCYRIVNLEPLTMCANLKKLNLSGCVKINDVSMLSACTSLRELDLSVVTDSHGLNFLSSLGVLEELSLTYCPDLNSLASLAECKKLQKLNMSNSKHITDISPLIECTALQELKIFGCKGVNDHSIKAFLQALPECKIYR